VDRAARRVATEEEKKKKDAEKAWARERMQARDALEKRRRRQERDRLPREPSPERPDDDDDNDDDEDDDMAAHLGLSLDPGPGQGLRCQPPSGLVPSVPGAGTLGSQSEERRQAEGAPDPSIPKIKRPRRLCRRLILRPLRRCLGRPLLRRLGRPRWE
jgi:hypothetical protein